MRIDRPTLALTLLLAATAPIRAQEWLAAETDRFTVVSQLSERDTLRWVRDFDRFINALNGLMPVNESLLPPLTAVLFRRDGAFAPYRLRTESGVATGNTGVFINQSSWSVIGMPGVRGASTDNSTVYHEAVHWYMSADPGRYPLWFREGIAEVFSTFDVEDGMAVWGRLIPYNIEFLQTFGLEPMEDFLEVSQDEAMHTNGTYYAQAWLFVHYLIFSRLEEGIEQLSPLLRNSQTMEPKAAFEASFEIGFEEMDRMLRSYSNERRLNVARSEIGDESGAAYDVRPASDELVEISLARLALGTRNDKPLDEHLARLASFAPDSPGIFDIQVVRTLSNGGSDIDELLDAAIERGSRDPLIYELKAATEIEAVRDPDAPWYSPDAFDSDDARRIANHLVSSANLRPLNMRVYEALSDVLFSVSEIRDYDRLALENGRVLFPGEGTIVAGQAALALDSGDREETRRLLGLAIDGSHHLSDSQRASIGFFLETMQGR